MNDFKTIRILICCLFALFSCRNSETQPHQTITVVSLSKNYSLLSNTAQQWDKDAYLQSAEIPVFAQSGENYLWLISAIFQSPQKEKESLLVTLETDGNVSSLIVAHKIKVNQTPPIILNTLTIDSQQAIDIFMTNEDIAKQLGHPNQNASLFIELNLLTPKQAVIWRLSTNMNAEGAQHFYLDALSGEYIEIFR